MKAGEKLEDASGAAVIVVKPPADGEVGFQPGGSVVVGKRYTCSSCEAMVLVTKPGTAEVVCHGETMALAQPKPLPSSD
ncbi:MAG: desulfoferrodoxin [Acidimicrobiia bacterium]|nr:desulfoferrodoxin [Acidimicrobiia bacterium]MBV9040688.1 desulfoferrodoxin [Acidimicrobiia bacterium]